MGRCRLEAERLYSLVFNASTAISPKEREDAAELATVAFLEQQSRVQNDFSLE